MIVSQDRLFIKRQPRDVTGPGFAALSGGFEAGREPGVATEEVTEGVEFADAPFRGGGQVGLDEGELRESFEGPPAASGTALLDLDGQDCPLGFIVREDLQVRAGGEPQDQVLESAEPAGKAAGVLRGRGLPVQVSGQPGAGQRPVAGDQVIQDRGVQDGLAGLAGLASAGLLLARCRPRGIGLGEGWRRRFHRCPGWRCRRVGPEGRFGPASWGRSALTVPDPEVHHAAQ